MKALLVEYGKVHHPQATREVRKTEVDWSVSPKDSLVTKNKKLCWVLPSGCLPCILAWSQKYIPASSMGRHFILRTILNEAIKPSSGKRSKRPKSVTASTSLQDNECFIQLLKQLIMNTVRLNTKKYSKAIILHKWMNQNLYSTLPINTSKIQTIFGRRSLP